MTTTTYFVPAIHCHHCIHTIKTEVADLAGVRSVDADLETQKVTITYEPPATPDKIEELLAEIDYPVQK
ncbi:MAG TPA: heavy-metal-associated domain-containing protein [Anaerolineaceae bacterium]|nr:heavy-metal-associated domain-containing protein [Anaerolineaceae bacterium]